THPRDRPGSRLRGTGLFGPRLFDGPRVLRRRVAADAEAARQGRHLRCGAGRRALPAAPRGGGAVALLSNAPGPGRRACRRAPRPCAEAAKGPLFRFPLSAAARRLVQPRDAPWLRAFRPPAAAVHARGTDARRPRPVPGQRSERGARRRAVARPVAEPGLGRAAPRGVRGERRLLASWRSGWRGRSGGGRPRDGQTSEAASFRPAGPAGPAARPLARRWKATLRGGE